MTKDPKLLLPAPDFTRWVFYVTRRNGLRAWRSDFGRRFLRELFERNMREFDDWLRAILGDDLPA